MPKRTVLRFLIPALLIAGAALVWLLWPNAARQAAMPTIAPIALVAIALLFVFQSFLEEMFDIPLAIWVIAAMVVVIGTALFFSTAIGVAGIAALIAVAAFFFFY
jgi:uncharacterized membrane protein